MKYYPVKGSENHSHEIYNVEHELVARFEDWDECKEFLNAVNESTKRVIDQVKELKRVSENAANSGDRLYAAMELFEIKQTLKEVL